MNVNIVLDDTSAMHVSYLLTHKLCCAVTLRVAAVVGHSLGSVMALHLAANTDLCQSVVFLSGLGLKPHRYYRFFIFIIHLHRQNGVTFLQF